MSILSKIKRGVADLPHRYVLAGPEGIGKSTFGSKAPKPLFICSEDGLTGLDHVARLTPRDFENLAGLYSVFDALLVEGPVSYSTVCIDTSDWLERFASQQCCARDGKGSIEDYGYGKGYTIIEEELVRILAKLDELRLKGFTIIILSHVNIRTFTDPAGPTYDRYEMKGHKKWTGLLREWPDAVLFAVREVHMQKEKGKPKERALGGDRVMHTEWSPAWDAKNRLNLPETLPLEWDDLQKAIKENSSANLAATARKLFTTAEISETDKAKWTKYLATLENQSADKIKAAIEKLTSLQKAA